MFKIRNEQMEAFRASVRSQFPQSLLHKLQTQPDVSVVQEPTTGDLLAADKRGYVTRMSFHPDGLPSTITKPSGLAYHFKHDDQGRLAVVIHPGGERVEVGRDAAGNISELRRPGLYSHRLSYDTQGRLVGAENPEGQACRLTYSDGNQLTTIVDRMEAATRFERDADGRLQAVIDPLGRRTQYETDSAGAIKAVVFADGSRQEYAFDPELNVATVTLRDGREVVQLMNAAGAITDVVWPDGSWVGFDFDERGNLANAVNADEEVVSTFDDAGNPLTEETSAGVVGYAYDAEGRLVELVTPHGDRIAYGYDEDGRLASIRDWEARETRIVYGAAGAIAEVRCGENLVETREHARVGRLGRAAVINASGTVLSEQTYAYDASERLTAMSDGWATSEANGSFARSYNYDAENRVLGERDTRTNKSLASFVYDLKGNITAHNDVTISVGPIDEPVRYGGVSISYDKLGQMLRVPGAATGDADVDCEWAADGTLRAAKAAGKTWRYTYDALCRRTSKTDGRSMWRYGWAGHQLLWEEHEARAGAAKIRRDYLWVPESTTPVAFREEGRTYWCQTDARGAVIAVFSEAGQLAWHASYDAFGQAQVDVAEVRQPLRLAGQYADDETGLYYNHARYYSPQLRTYLSRDPLWHKWNTTNYSYAHNDPLNQIDPVGAMPGPLLVGALLVGGAALVGAAVGGAVAWATGGDVVSGAIDGGLSAGGAALGGIIGMLGGPVGAGIGLIAGGAAGAFGADLINQWRRGDPLCMPCAFGAAGMSIGFDLLTLGLSRIPGVKQLVRAVGKRMYAAGKPIRDWARRQLSSALRSARRGLTRAREAIARNATRARQGIERRWQQAKAAIREAGYKARGRYYEWRDKGHSLDRHGPQVSNADLERRIKTGITPDDKFSPTPASTRFSSHEDWVKTRQSALREIEVKEGIDLRKPPPPGHSGRVSRVVEHGRAIDEGYVADRSTRINNFPDPLGSGRTGRVFGTTNPVDGLTRTTTTVQWNPARQRWDVKQHFPNADGWNTTTGAYSSPPPP